MNTTLIDEREHPLLIIQNLRLHPTPPSKRPSFTAKTNDCKPRWLPMGLIYQTLKQSSQPTTDVTMVS